MIKATAIDLPNSEPMMVTWDTGRRCNFDCSYCELSRHDNISNFHSFEELKKTFMFINEWSTTYNSYRKDVNSTNINFTGGEPTMNPAFWELAEWINNNYSGYNLGVTTNGAWSPKHTKKFIELFGGVTVSYHAEGKPTLKKHVIENIKRLHESDIWLQVNVMLHVDYFEECKDLCEQLKKLGIRHNPRPIGDGNIKRTGWFTDIDGSMRRTSHDYTQDQQDWFFNYSGIKKPTTKTLSGDELGRKCCGGRCLSGKVNDQWQEVKLVDTNFKNWLCTVDWFFLHIDQHTGNVYHHQTCKALHDGNRGPVGTLKDTDTMLLQMKNRLSQNELRPIVCPNMRCGCGMCAPKAKSQEDFTKMWNRITTKELQ